MSLEKLIKNRQSCRKYQKEKKIEPEILEQILNAGRLAPSACNSQPYHLYLTKGEKTKAIAKARSFKMNKFIENCSNFIIITEADYCRMAAAGAKIKKQDYRSVDIGIVTAFICLQASELGVDNCILGMFDEKKVQDICQSDRRIRVIIALGYKDEKEKQRKKIRKSKEELITILG